MERYGTQWLQKGTHEEHLSVLDYEKKMRSEEMESLEATIDSLVAEVKDTQKSSDNVQAKLDDLQERENLISKSG